MVASWEEEMVESVKSNDLPTLKTILSRDEVKRNGDLGRMEWKNDEDPLHAAALMGRDQMVSVMVEAGFDVNSFCVEEGDEDHCKTTSLHWTVFKNQVSTVKLLLDLGADCTMEGEWDGEVTGSPVDWAKERNNKEIVLMFEEHLGESKNHNDDPVKAFVAKVASKRKLKADLKKAITITDEIEAEKERLEPIKRKRDELTAEVNVIERNIDGLKEKAEYKTPQEIKRMRKDLQDISEITQAVEKVAQDDPDRHCPVCFEAPEMVFSCVQCHNWICESCWYNKGLESCPSCRIDFKESPPMRNFTAEKLLRRS